MFVILSAWCLAAMLTAVYLHFATKKILAFLSDDRICTSTQLVEEFGNVDLSLEILEEEGLIFRFDLGEEWNSQRYAFQITTRGRDVVES